MTTIDWHDRRRRAEQIFKPGTIVRLRSYPSPEMVVTEVFSTFDDDSMIDGVLVEAIWFNTESEQRRGQFLPETLRVHIGDGHWADPGDLLDAQKESPQ